MSVSTCLPAQDVQSRSGFSGRLLAIALLLAGGASTISGDGAHAADGLERSVAAYEYGKPKVSRKIVAQKLVWSARNCWIGKYPNFKGFRVSGPHAAGANHWRVRLRKSGSGEYLINVAQNDKGYFVQLVRPKALKKLDSPVKSSIDAIESGLNGC